MPATQRLNGNYNFLRTENVCKRQKGGPFIYSESALAAVRMQT